MAKPVEFGSSFITKVAGEIESRVIERMDKITLETHNILVADTNVDYGQARAGWNIFLNDEKASAPDAPPRAKAGDSKTVLAPPENAPDRDAKKIGDKYLITNPVEHIVYMNEGTSETFPKGFIDRAPFTAVSNVERSLK